MFISSERIKPKDSRNFGQHNILVIPNSRPRDVFLTEYNSHKNSEYVYTNKGYDKIAKRCFFQLKQDQVKFDYMWTPARRGFLQNIIYVSPIRAQRFGDILSCPLYSLTRNSGLSFPPLASCNTVSDILPSLP